jgi:quercetin 2,3-dioxygenase
MMKKLSFIRRNDERHWVGDGFPVCSIFSYNDLGQELSPFLLLDYAGPENFPPSQQRRGVGEHPHRGFETVTIVYSGEVEHRDSSGGGSSIGPGDVRWMTAASGLVHEEFHGTEYAKRGGPFEMIQLWVNLAAKDKKAAPAYQNITNWERVKSQVRRNWPSWRARMTRSKSRRWKTARSCYSMAGRSMSRSLAWGLL